MSLEDMHLLMIKRIIARRSIAQKRGATHLQHHLLDEREHERKCGQAADGHADAEHLLRYAGGLVGQVLPKDHLHHLRTKQYIHEGR